MSDPNHTVHLPLLLPTPKDGTEPLHHGAVSAGVSVLDFWRWAYSDLLANTTRGVLAEFIVATAIGARSSVRDPWQGFDLQTPSGITIEVKASAFLQSWGQRGVSKPIFGIAPTRAPVEGTGAYQALQQRQAQVYVFCLLTGQDKAKVDPLDLGSWEFLVVSTARLNRQMPAQKSLSLAALRRISPRMCAFGELLSRIEEVVRETPL